MRRDDRPLSKHTINLFAGDFEEISAAFPRPGANKIIRELVSKFIKNFKTQTDQKAPIEPKDLSDDDLSL